MIEKEISGRVLLIGTDVNGHGGIATLLTSYSKMFEHFNFICSHKFTSRINQIFIAFSALLKLLYYLIFKNISIVHIHTASYMSFYRESIYLLIAKMFNKKVILHLHGGDFFNFYDKNRFYCKFICKKATVLVGVSKFFSNLFKEHDLCSNIIFLYNVVEKPILLKNKQSDKINILFLGSIDEHKGIFDVLEMLGLYKNLFKDKITLTICGEGNSLRLLKLIKDYDLESFVTFLGWVNNDKKNVLLSNTDIYLQPSKYESLGIAIIEALSYGIPVIASNTGGIPELVDDGKNGFLIPVGNMQMLKTILLNFCNSVYDFKLFEPYAKSKASLFYSEHIEKKVFDMYNKILKDEL